MHISNKVLKNVHFLTLMDKLLATKPSKRSSFEFDANNGVKDRQRPHRLYWDYSQLLPFCSSGRFRSQVIQHSRNSVNRFDFSRHLSEDLFQKALISTRRLTTSELDLLRWGCGDWVLRAHLSWNLQWWKFLWQQIADKTAVERRHLCRSVLELE